MVEHVDHADGAYARIIKRDGFGRKRHVALRQRLDVGGDDIGAQLFQEPAARADFEHGPRPVRRHSLQEGPIPFSVEALQKAFAEQHAPVRKGCGRAVQVGFVLVGGEIEHNGRGVRARSEDGDLKRKRGNQPR
jgi:hypothetical protein